MMWVSLAGPVSNLLMAMLAAIPFRVGLVSTFVAFTSPGNILPSLDKLLYEFVLINLILMLFNLIPISPLDGEKIAYHLLPPSGQQVMDNIRPYGPLILLALLFIVPYLGFDVLGFILGQPMRALLGLLVG
jgi:Zn-dependent protease